jgi:hypothetical protein
MKLSSTTDHSSKRIALPMPAPLVVAFLLHQIFDLAGALRQQVLQSSFHRLLSTQEFLSLHARQTRSARVTRIAYAWRIRR